MHIQNPKSYSEAMNLKRVAHMNIIKFLREQKRIQPLRRYKHNQLDLYMKLHKYNLGSGLFPHR